jgi:hypothetical protein
MIRKSWIRTSAVALSLALAAAPFALAGPAPMAEMSVGAATVDWHASGTYERWVLTVSSPSGQVVRQELDGRSSPSFGLFDAAGNRRPDGTYQWELRAVPQIDPAIRKQLAEARAQGRSAAVEAELRTAGKLPAEHVQSGSFAIVDGSFVGPGLREERGPQARPQKQMTNITDKDQVIPDDLIVQGSACVGLDCVNNESFGFDTIRLKENNTRIKFDDTSSSTGFPANDWQLTANDSASGGSSKFSIEDITGSKVPFTVTAGASTNSIFVDSTGRVGFRTSTPVLDLHVATSNTPAIRLEQNNSGGFTAQTWDIAGNEANFFVRDVTGGSRLPFRIRPGAPTSSIDINASGNVGIGTASATEDLTLKSKAANSDVFLVQGSAASSPTLFRIFETTAGDTIWSAFDQTQAEALRFTTVSGGRLAIGCNAPEHDIDLGSSPGTACNAVGSRSFVDAGSTTFTASSSRDLKENLVPMQVPNILDKISSVEVYNYDFINGPKDKIGLMAEDFHTVFGNGSNKTINGQDVEMALWLAVQELTARNKDLTAQNSELLQRLERIESRLSETAAQK